MRPLRMARLLVGAMCLLPLTSMAEPFGYSVNSDAPQNADQLYRIDLATGAATAIGAVGFEDVEGLAMAPDGVLWAVDDALDRLLQINTVTGQAANRGLLGLAGQGTGPNFALDYGLAITCDGRAWLSGDQASTLWEVSLATGEARNPSALPLALSGLAASGKILYGVSVEAPPRLVRIDTETREATIVGPLGIDATQDAGADFDANGNLWVITDDSPAASPPPNRIYRINLQTGAATFVANAPFGMEGLAIAATAPCSAASPPLSAQIVPGPDAYWLGLLALVAGLAAARRLRGRSLH